MKTDNVSFGSLMVSQEKYSKYEYEWAEDWIILVGSLTRNAVPPPSTGLFVVRLDAVVKGAEKSK